RRPRSLVACPCPYRPGWRGIRLSPNSIRLVAGGQFVRQIPFDGSGVVGLDQITAAINDPDWIAEVAPGVFELRATFVQAADTAVDVRAPRVTTVRLDDRPGVAFAGNHARATFDGVTVTSWNEQTQAPDTSVVGERPYVVYAN